MAETNRAVRKGGWWRRAIGAVAGGVILLLVLNWAVSSWILFRLVDDLTLAARGREWRFGERSLNVVLRPPAAEDPTTASVARATIRHDGRTVRVCAEYDEYAGLVTAGRQTGVWVPKTGAFFDAGACAMPCTRRALDEAVDKLPAAGAVKRVALALYLHPLLVGWQREDGDRLGRIALLGGTALVRPDGSVRALEIQMPVDGSTWGGSLNLERMGGDLPVDAPVGRSPIQVAPEDFDRSLAALVELAALRLTPVRPDPDGVRREGEGWLEVRDGRRYLHLRGDARTIGYQHGRLLSNSVQRLAHRIAYGIGLVYSVEEGRWFMDDAKALVARQRPHIDPAYFEEMRGLAEGAGVPLEIIQVANIFPEFFHCSGVALAGKATRDGTLLHARVLDYMTDAGLQDEAAVIATARTGARRFVNVGYAGFVGCVSGMNEQRVAIGEMGGGGDGQWDGTPMSLLIRGALESCDSLEAVLAYFRSHKRTCEYYYVVSDGKTRAMAGVKATPGALEVVGPGERHPQLPDAVEDAVVLSAGSRYTTLVQRIRTAYGRIDERALIDIIDRPVAMRGNLHNVVFAPEDRSLAVANAGRDTPACREPYTRTRWEELFPDGR